MTFISFLVFVWWFCFFWSDGIYYLAVLIKQPVFLFSV